MGKKLAWVMLLMIYTATGIAISAYLRLIKSEMPELLMGIADNIIDSSGSECYEELPWWTDGQKVYLFILLFFVVPLASLKRIDFLAFTSTLAMICMMIFSGIVIAFTPSIDCPIEIVDKKSVTLKCKNFANATAHNVGEHYTEFVKSVSMQKDNVEEYCNTRYFNLKETTGNVIPTILFSFMCLETMLPMYLELRRKGASQQVMLLIARSSMSLVAGLYTLVAFFGYQTWKKATLDDVLIMYSINNASSIWIIIARICSLTCIIFSAPLVHYPNRVSLIGMIWGKNYTFRWWKHLLTMTFTLLCSVYIVENSSSMGSLFSYGGILTGTPVLVIFPAMFILKLDDMVLDYQNKPAKEREDVEAEKELINSGSSNLTTSQMMIKLNLNVEPISNNRRLISRIVMWLGIIYYVYSVGTGVIIPMFKGWIGEC